MDVVVLIVAGLLASVLQVALWIWVLKPVCPHVWVYDPGPPEAIRCAACGALDPRL